MHNFSGFRKTVAEQQFLASIPLHDILKTLCVQVVKLWDFETGNFMFEFNKAHGDSAITSIAFDTSGRRLITAGRDGAVRIWNYNNGHCLRSLERGKKLTLLCDLTEFSSKL